LIELSLHLLDIVRNAVEAGGSRIEITIEEDLKKDVLCMEVSDNGKGMSKDQMAMVLDPFYTTRKTRQIGLGLPLLLEACRRCEGNLEIFSDPGKGTRIQATFRHSHIDRAPLGNLPSVLMALVLSENAVDWIYIHRVNGEAFQLDSYEIKKELGEIPLTHPKVRHWLLDVLVEGENSLLSKESTTRATS
jgi:hypothetical protein